MQRLREDESVAESGVMRRGARRAMGARMYMPEIGRFLSVDPLAEAFPTQSPYNFAYNNPINFRDPSGLAPEKEKGDMLLVSSGGLRSNNNDFCYAVKSSKLSAEQIKEICDGQYYEMQAQAAMGKRLAKCTWNSAAIEIDKYWAGQNGVSTGTSVTVNNETLKKGPITIDKSLVSYLEKVMNAKLKLAPATTMDGAEVFVITGFTPNEGSREYHSFQYRFLWYLKTGYACELNEVSGVGKSTEFTLIKDANGMETATVSINLGTIGNEENNIFGEKGIFGAPSYKNTPEQALAHEFFGHFEDRILSGRAWDGYNPIWVYNGNGGVAISTQSYCHDAEAYAMKAENLWLFINNKPQRGYYHNPCNGYYDSNGNKINHSAYIWSR